MAEFLSLRNSAFFMGMLERLLEQLLFPRKRVPTRRLQAALSGKTVLLTGASYGIGAQTARLLAMESVTLILVARTEARLEALARELAPTGAQVQYHALDLTDGAAVDELVAQLLASSAGVDVVISNAGRSILRSVYAATDRLHDYERTMQLNYLAPVRLLLPLLPLLTARGGQLIHVSAANVLLLPAPYWSAYQASKVAFDHWFRSVGIELRARGVQCSTAYFPLVRTRMIAPTAAYQSVPAMSPEQAAVVLARLVAYRQRQFKPWWLVFGQVGSGLFRGLWEWGLPYFLPQKKRG